MEVTTKIYFLEMLQSLWLQQLTYFGNIQKLFTTTLAASLSGWVTKKSEIPLSHSPIGNKMGMLFRERKSYKIARSKFLSFLG
jgi:hypothetical protein